MHQADPQPIADDVVVQSDLYDLATEPVTEAWDETDWSDGTDEIPSDWDEPEPTIDASSDLRESLYPPDESVTNLSLELKISAFLMQVVPIDEEQRQHCAELLRECGLPSLRRLLPWLRNRTWRGPQLRLFLLFRKHWGQSANQHWWETFLWSEREQRWMPRYARGILTLDHARILVKARSRYAANDVIDERWFWEWNSYAVWQLGLRSFADFAVFRAEIPTTEDWWDYLARRDDRGILEIEQCSDRSFAPFMIPSFAEQYRLPRALFNEADAWPCASELAREKAQVPGWSLARAWCEILNDAADER